MPVLDIVAKGVEIDFFRREFHFRRAPQPPGVVDDAHQFKRRGLRGAQLPNAQSFQCGDGTREQGGGAVVGLGGAFAGQHGGKAGAGQGNRCGQSRWPAAHHDGRRLLALIVRHQNARLRCVLTD